MQKRSKVYSLGSSTSHASLLVFAHVPPPDHGQSRMVAAMLRALEGSVSAIHIDARFSNEISDVGDVGLVKCLRIFCFIGEALWARWKRGARSLYYVPGPVKWSSVIRDWVVLGVLRPFFPHLVLHWHAIGQGEWSSGSERVRLRGPAWLDRCARSISSWLLSSPDLSIAVSPGSANDGRCLGSWCSRVLSNGLEDPCRGDQSEMIRKRCHRIASAKDVGKPLRVLFFSRGTREKGVMDALNTIAQVMEERPGLKLNATFAGGLDPAVEKEFHDKRERLIDKGLKLELLGFTDGEEKQRCFRDHDLLLSTSHWESFGLTVVEAMAWGLPVVAAASDGVAGVVPSSYRYLAPVGEVSSLATSLLCLIDDIYSGDAGELACSLRERYENEFTLDAFEAATVKLFVEELAKFEN